VVALAWGVFAAGAIQMIVQWVALTRLGVLPRFRFNFAYPGVRRVLKLMLPTIFGSSVAQINLLIGTLFASLLATGSQTWLYLTDRLLEFPLGMFGVALGTVILPNLSRQHTAIDPKGYSATLDWGLRMALLISLPAALGLMLMADPLNATLYQYGRFSDFDTHMAALALAALSAGLPGFMLAKILAPAFYARQDTRTPVRAAIYTLLANMLLNVVLVTPAWYTHLVGGHALIALSSALAGTLNAALLYRYLRQQGHYSASPGWRSFWLRLGLACLVLIAVVLAARWLVGDFGVLRARWRVIHLGWIIAVAAGCYAGALYASGLRPRHLREA
jgi:putative peptidoglycan lipid II flippase